MLELSRVTRMTMRLPGTGVTDREPLIDGQLIKIAVADPVKHGTVRADEPGRLSPVTHLRRCWMEFGHPTLARFCRVIALAGILAGVSIAYPVAAGAGDAENGIREISTAVPKISRFR